MQADKQGGQGEQTRQRPATAPGISRETREHHHDCCGDETCGEDQADDLESDLVFGEDARDRIAEERLVQVAGRPSEQTENEDADPGGMTRVHGQNGNVLSRRYRYDFFVETV